MAIQPEMIVADVMARWPATVPVLLEAKLGCVGCTMAPYDTLQDVVDAYGLDQGTFFARLDAAIHAPPVEDATPVE